MLVGCLEYTHTCRVSGVYRSQGCEGAVGPTTFLSGLSAYWCAGQRCSEMFVKLNPLNDLPFFPPPLFLQALLGPLGILGPKGSALDTWVASSWFSTVRQMESLPAPRACPGSGQATVCSTWKDRREHTIRTSVSTECWPPMCIA